ncbi:MULTISPECIES: stage III sporulation protein AB [Halorussus]|uniref:stage III sporulation protein AB n=1 Tax=Halorussus TaxID=1070314 RepID=UPI0020A0517C|nr:stage III sporulation protein AB [Halorussus vallis]USZ75038.1 stage III sporulation protein AB [Halorussus vallis]
MTLDVETPDPPALRGPQHPGDYDAVDELEDETGDTHRRENLAEFLQNGAWEDAFEEWAEHTYLTDEEFRVVRELGLIDEFDFYWNPSDEDVGYRAPTVPDELPEPYDETLERGDVQGIDEALDALGRTVSEVMENDYIHRDASEFGYSWE